MALQSNIYYTQANIQYGYAQRALRAGNNASAATYNRRGDEYTALARMHLAREAAATNPVAAATQVASRSLPGTGPTATAQLSVATDVQTMNGAISTQSAVAAATRAVNGAQTPDPGASGTISQLAVQTQAQDYIDAPINFPVAGPAPTYQGVTNAASGVVAAASGAASNAGPGPQLQDVIDAQNGGGNGLPAYMDASRSTGPSQEGVHEALRRAMSAQGIRGSVATLKKCFDMLPNDTTAATVDANLRQALRDPAFRSCILSSGGTIGGGINPIYIGVGLIGVAIVARAVMR